MLLGRSPRRRRRNVQVRGFGCCLPLSLGLASTPVLALGVLVRALSERRQVADAARSGSGARVATAACSAVSTQPMPIPARAKPIASSGRLAPVSASSP